MKRSRKDLKDAPCSDRPEIPTSKETIEKVRNYKLWVKYGYITAIVIPNSGKSSGKNLLSIFKIELDDSLSWKSDSYSEVSSSGEFMFYVFLAKPNARITKEIKIGRLQQLL